MSSVPLVVIAEMLDKESLFGAAVMGMLAMEVTVVAAVAMGTEAAMIDVAVTLDVGTLLIVVALATDSIASRF